MLKAILFLKDSHFRFYRFPVLEWRILILRPFWWQEMTNFHINYLFFRYSWTENLYGSSSFPATKTDAGSESVTPEPETGKTGSGNPSELKSPLTSPSGSLPSGLSPSVSSSSLLEVTDHLEIDRFDTRLGTYVIIVHIFWEGHEIWRKGLTVKPNTSACPNPTMTVFK